MTKKPFVMLRAPVAALALAVLAGCAARTPPPPAFADYAGNVQIARLLAGGCPSVEIDQAAMGAGARDLGVSLRDAGYSPEDIAAFPDTLETGTIQTRIQDYVTRSGIDPRDSATVCPAARREIDNGTAIGAFLSPA